jgi:hypothetical protein
MKEANMKIGYKLVGAAGSLIIGVTTASAAVVCNDEGDCWRVKKRVEYRPELRLRTYDDDWKWKSGEKYRWRESQGDHGYWRGGIWVNID